MRFYFLCVFVLVFVGVCRADEKTIVVSGDGSGDYKTVQDAIGAAPEKSDTRTIIYVKPGTYAGPFIIPQDKPNLTIEGDDPASTILSWDRNVRDPIPKGNDGFNPGVEVRGNDFQAVRLTIQNISGDHGQALALRSDGDRAVFVDCRIMGWQDTVMVNNGRDYFQNCYIAGRVDFIYGSATAWFQDCEIHSRNGGHVTAASTPQDHPYGFVFKNCRLTGDSIPYDPATTNPSTTQKPKITPQADLGRPWRPYASVTYLDCEMGSHIKPAGWNNWGKKSNEKTARYSEYQSTGAGAAPDQRAGWSHQLTDEQAKQITIQAVLGGDDNWDPRTTAQAMTAFPTTQK
jgi:pectinesterase